MKNRHLLGKTVATSLLVAIAFVLCQPGLIRAQKNKTSKTNVLDAPAKVFATGGVPKDVDKRITQFFNALHDKKVKLAYDLLLGDSELAKDEPMMESLVTQTTKLQEVYGKFAGSEIFRTRTAGSRLLRVETLAFSKTHPFHWTFYFYKTPAGWKAIDINVNNNVKEMFDDKN